MLKIKKEDLPIILTTDDYIELIGAPNEKMTDQDLLILQKWIQQSTEQIDSMISAYNESGYLYRFWNNLKDTPEDNSKGYKLQLAIAKWVECIVISGKFWVDNIPSMSSNVQYNISSSSEDSNIEIKRKDIIKDLSSIGLLQTSNIVNTNHNQVTDREIDDYVLLSKKFLFQNFLALNSIVYGQTMLGPVNWANNSLNYVGDITGNIIGDALRTISNYNLKNIGKIIGSDKAPKSTLENFTLINCDVKNVDLKANLIKQWNSDEYVTIDKINSLAFFGPNLYGFGSAVERGELYTYLSMVNMSWNPIFNYKKDTIVPLAYQNEEGAWKLADFLCLKDNVNVYPLNDTTGTWQPLGTVDIDLNAIIEIVYNRTDEKYGVKFEELTNGLKNATIPNEVEKQLNELPTIENVIYNKGIWYPFESYAFFRSVIEEYGLTFADYDVLPYGRFVAHKESGDVEPRPIGDRTIQQYHLPDINFWGSLIYAVVGYTNTPTEASKPKEQFYYNDASPDVTEIAGMAVWTAEKRKMVKYGFFLNGGVPQSEFIPYSTTGYYVKFNKDIVKKSVIKVDVPTPTVTFASISGYLIDNANAKSELSSMVHFTQASKANGLITQKISLANVNDLSQAKHMNVMIDDPLDNVFDMNYDITTTETKTGNFMNGKPIYVISGEIMCGPSGVTTILAENIGDIVRTSGYVKEAPEQVRYNGMFLPIWNAERNFTQFTFKNNALSITNEVDEPLIIKYIVEYTKI